MTTADLLEPRVSFDTTSRNRNLALIGYVRDYPGGCGVSFRISGNPAGQRANPQAMTGPWEARALALSGQVASDRFVRPPARRPLV